MQALETTIHPRLLGRAIDRLRRLESKLVLHRAEALESVDTEIQDLQALKPYLQVKAVDDTIDAYLALRAELVAINPDNLPAPEAVECITARLQLLGFCAIQLRKLGRVAETKVSKGEGEQGECSRRGPRLAASSE